MKRQSARLVLGLITAVAILAAAKCGSKGYVTASQSTHTSTFQR
jgi:hypothetical protein